MAKQDLAKTFNIEYRAADATANPWIVLGTLINAMHDGLKRALPIAHIIDEEIEGSAHVTAMPTSLESALEYLAKDLIVQSWFNSEMLQTFIGIRSNEAAEMNGLTPTERCARYVSVY
jgi:glutamine synthetase